MQKLSWQFFLSILSFLPTVMLAASIIWMIVAIIYGQAGDYHSAEVMVRHNVLEC